MEQTVFVILLLTGFRVPSAAFPNSYYFVRQNMTWDDAHLYCMSEYTEMAQIFSMENVTTMMNTPTGGYKDKAWIGLYDDFSAWSWADGHPVTYFNWKVGQSDASNATEMCVTINIAGYWKDNSCSEEKAAVCFYNTGSVDNSGNYTFIATPMTWTDAKTYCENQYMSLATIPDNITNSLVMQTLQDTAWIGLSRLNLWYWSDTGENTTFTNWEPLQPDNPNTGDNCAAAVVRDGTWTDEHCNATYPFFCYGIHKSRKTVVKMKIQSSANMEDPAFSNNLQQQLQTAFINSQGTTQFKLTWKKLPVEQTQKSRDKR